MSNNSEHGVPIHITSSAGEVVLLEDSVDPQFIEDFWESMKKDPDLREIAHATLELASKHYPGTDQEAIHAYKGMLAGAAAATLVVLHSLGQATRSKDSDAI